MKALSDAAVREGFGEQAPIVRPGSIDMNRFARLALTVCVMAPPTAMRGPHRGAQSAPVDTLAPGLEVLREVHRRYSTTRFRTLTFVQKTTFPDGRVEWWYEAESIPGKARVDVAPFANRNMQIFRNDSAYVFQDGALARTGGGLALTMWTLMDMYAIPPEETAAALTRRGVDMERVHERMHGGRPVVVVGALEGDTTSAQVWLDREHLYAVKMIVPRGGHRVIDVGRHTYLAGGWVEQEITVWLDGRMTLHEEYFDVRANMALPPDLFEPDTYRAPPWRETRW
jgi:hypothetical protein